MARAISLLLLLLTFSVLHAELPPSAYEEMQKKASEFVKIRVLQVTVGPGEKEGQTLIEATAQVLEVKRSAAGLKPDAIIHIEYHRMEQPQGFVGPRPIPLLQQGEETIAFLAPLPDSPDYQPAAGGMSFEQF